VTLVLEVDGQKFTGEGSASRWLSWPALNPPPGKNNDTEAWHEVVREATKKAVANAKSAATAARALSRTEVH